MFFRGGDKKEEISVKELVARSDSYFDEKLADFGRNSSKIEKDILSALQQFTDACIEFDKVTAEPNTDFIFRGNPDFIKSQKAAYVSMLNGTLKSYGKDSHAQNLHEKYRNVQESLESIINNVLKVNGQFKNVVIAYPRHLDRFKNAFSKLEHLSMKLKHELEKIDPQLTEYNELKRHIQNILALFEENNMIENEIITLGTMASTSNNTAFTQTKELKAKLREKTEELDAVKKKKDRLEFDLTALLTSLNKPARLYDHASASKHKLEHFTENPIQALENNNSCTEFDSLLADMKIKVISNALQLKNKQEILSRIKVIEMHDLYGDLSEIDMLKNKTAILLEEIKMWDRSVEELENISSASKNREEKQIELEKRLGALLGSIKNEKSDIETLILNYYGKKVSLLLDK